MKRIKECIGSNPTKFKRAKERIGANPTRRDRISGITKLTGERVYIPPPPPLYEEVYDTTALMRVGVYRIFFFLLRKEI